MQFSDKVVIITGGAQGIGLACARQFLNEGAKVVIADLDEEQGKDAAETLKKGGRAVEYIHADVGERLDVHNMLAATLDAFGEVDILINNAGLSVGRDFLELEEADFDRVIQTNLKGPFLCSQTVARQMIQQMEDSGEAGQKGERGYSIINMSSVSAIATSPDNAIFAASKAGLNQLTRAMALSLAPKGIRVNAIAPGNISTNLAKEEMASGAARDRILSRTPLGRIGDPDEIASIARFLASPDAAYVTGQCIYADGGRLALNYTMAKD